MPEKSKPRVTVIGGGPAGLMAAEVLAAGGASVTLYDRMPSLGRKFLMAGRGGLNLTHSEDVPRVLARYGKAEPRLRDAIEAFPPGTLRAWSKGLGQPTFVGTSGRVFPKAMKASPLLRAWLRRLDGLGVVFKPRHFWTGWDEAGHAVFDAPDGRVTVEADATVLALGGASWPRLGSGGEWVETLHAADVKTVPLAPANCGFTVVWSGPLRDKFAGHPLKRIALSFGETKVRGEAMITATGLEGGAVYALSGRLREALAGGDQAQLLIDLRPDMARSQLERRLAAPRGKRSLSTFLRKAANLSPVAIGLLHEAAAARGGLAVLTPTDLAALIQAVPLRLTGVAPIARAISSAGGVAFDQLDERFMLRKRPGVFVAGEMLDWEAPTGGYLLQACFATGVAAGKGALAWLARG